MQKAFQKVLKVPVREFHLENTLVNGQCFNWSKVKEDHFEGIWRQFYIQI